jgi:UrcA family protein
MKTLYKTLIAAAAILSLAPLGAQADALSTPSSTQRVAISYGQLDLNDAAAVDTLYRQLANAAERACGAYDARNLRERNAWRACRETAFSAGVAQLVEAQIAAGKEEVAPATASIAGRY